jgi:hypothetical protein
MKCGLLKLCSEAVAVGPIVYHDMHSTLGDSEEVQAIVAALAPDNKVCMNMCSKCFNGQLSMCSAV